MMRMLCTLLFLRLVWICLWQTITQRLISTWIMLVMLKVLVAPIISDVVGNMIYDQLPSVTRLIRILIR